MFCNEDAILPKKRVSLRAMKGADDILAAAVYDKAAVRTLAKADRLKVAPQPTL
jgi:hypothetical protein